MKNLNLRDLKKKCIILFFITVLIFAYTVDIRKPWFGNVSGGFEWLTGATLIYTKNWYREGIFELRFLMMEKPKSVELPNFIDMSPYIGYPPGSLIPIFMVSKIIGHEPTPELVMSYNLFNHFLIAFFSSLIIFFFLVSLGFDSKLSFSFALIPPIFELLAPGTLYWHQNVYFADQAVILPFVIIIFLEVLRGFFSKKTILDLLTGIIIFWGAFTDLSLFFYITLILYLKRLILNEGHFKNHLIKNSLIFLIPLLLTLAYYFYVPLSLNLFPKLIFRLMMRSVINYDDSLSDDGNHADLSHFFEEFWIKHFTFAFGKFSASIIFLTLALLLISSAYLIYCSSYKKNRLDRRILKITTLIILILLPCIAQIYTFMNHSFVHNYSAGKFSLALALSGFVLSPILIILLLYQIRPFKKKMAGIQQEKVFFLLFIVCFLIFLPFIHNMHKDYRSLFPNLDPSLKEIGFFIDSNTGYKDIVFSPDIEINKHPPEPLSFSMKLVYNINSVSDIYEITKDIKENYDINIFFLDKTGKPKYLLDLLSLSYNETKKDGMNLYKIKRDTFLKSYNYN